MKDIAHLERQNTTVQIIIRREQQEGADDWCVNYKKWLKTYMH